jgi:hypothetical protein
MTLKLDTYDYEQIARLVAQEKEGRGVVYYSDLDIEVTYFAETSGYVEDDYFNGTGAWVTTSTHVDIISIECGDVSVEYDDRELEACIRRELQ